MTSIERRQSSDGEPSPEKTQEPNTDIGKLVDGMWDANMETVLTCVTTLAAHFDDASTELKCSMIKTLIEHNGLPKMVELIKVDDQPDIQDQIFFIAKDVISYSAEDQLTLLLDTGIWPTCMKLLALTDGKAPILSEMLLGLLAVRRPEFAAPLVSVFLQGIQSPDKDTVLKYIEKAASIVCWSHEGDAVIKAFFAQDGTNILFKTMEFGDRPDIQINACELMGEIFSDDKFDLAFLEKTDVHKTLLALLDSGEKTVIEAALDTMFLVVLKVESFRLRFIQQGLVRSLIRIVSHNDEETLLETVACWFNFLCDREHGLTCQVLIGCMSALKLIMMCKTEKAVFYACIALTSITGGTGQLTDSDRHMSQSVVDSGFLPWLLRIFYRDDAETKVASLETLHNISRAGCDQLIAALVKEGAFHTLLDVLIEESDDEDLTRLATAVLENILRYGEKIDQFEILWEPIIDMGLEIRFEAFLETLEQGAM